MWPVRPPSAPMPGSRTPPTTRSRTRPPPPPRVAMRREGIMDERISCRRVITALLAGVLAIAGLLAVAPQPATAATGPITAGLTITPSSTTVGTGVTVTGSAKNTSSTTQMVSMGVDIPGNITSANVKGSNCTPRHLTKLIYCGLGLAPGATATITFTATPRVSGTFNFRSYARITYTTDDTFAYATITAS